MVVKSLDTQTPLNTALALGQLQKCLWNSSGKGQRGHRLSPTLVQLWRIMESLGLGKKSKIMDSMAQPGPWSTVIPPALEETKQGLVLGWISKQPNIGMSIRSWQRGKRNLNTS